jgi:predicted helicase
MIYTAILKRKRQAPDGSVDQNVFDIQQGVAIGIFIKHGSKKQEYATVYHADLYGARIVKYSILEQLDVSNTEWVKLEPSSPFYLFVPQNTNLLAEYEKNWKITEIMPINLSGVTTHRDYFVYDDKKTELEQRIIDFTDLTISDIELKHKYELKDTGSWQLKQARKILSNLDWKQYFTKCLYRPFEVKYYYFHDSVVDRPRNKIMQQIINKENVMLGIGRQGLAVKGNIWHLVICSNYAIDTNVFRRGGVNTLPLYIYPSEKEEFLNGNGNGSNTPKPARKPNFSPEFIQDLEQRLKLQFISEGNGDFHHTISATDVFYYIYAIFHSPSYRKRYAEFLKMDFPRLPIIRDKNLFQKLAKLGGQLVEIHLMQADINNDCGYPKTGNNIVDKLYYDEKQQRIYINKIQYFDQVKPEIWNFYIGGYQICQKWLKDRKGLALSFDDLKHYLYILAALEKTAELMQEIDIILLRSETILDLC